ncbi:hypothetical protein ACSU1N_01370 [Thermogladius sp. 4427co]|uniref:hypothetical protein n=1 Tax=Thermogladius sp. 4427co TaxID=3450718 RepID=UPI003F796E2E
MSKTPQQPQTTKSKELKIVTRHVVTLSDVEKNPRLIKLLYIISSFKDISEKALLYLLYYMHQNGYGMGYNFIVIGQVPSSKDVSSDLTVLKYLGLVEVNERKKLSISSLGREFLAKHVETTLKNEKETIDKLVNELRVKIAPVDAEVEIRVKKRPG